MLGLAGLNSQLPVLPQLGQPSPVATPGVSYTPSFMPPAAPAGPSAADMLAAQQAQIKTQQANLKTLSNQFANQPQTPTVGGGPPAAPVSLNPTLGQIAGGQAAGTAAANNPLTNLAQGAVNLQNQIGGAITQGASNAWNGLTSGIGNMLHPGSTGAPFSPLPNAAPITGPNLLGDPGAAGAAGGGGGLLGTGGAGDTGLVGDALSGLGGAGAAGGSSGVLGQFMGQFL